MVRHTRMERGRCVPRGENGRVAMNDGACDRRAEFAGDVLWRGVRAARRAEVIRTQ
jgi:hypothetical protein